MTNSEKTITFKLSEETYDRLTAIKNHLNITYSEVIEKLVELELQNNYIYKIREYEFITRKSEGIFRIIFRKQDHIIEYLTSDKSFVRNINSWSCEDKNLFKKFLAGPDSFTLLENLGVSIEYEDFIIFGY